jgi:hypothetical protein
MLAVSEIEQERGTTHLPWLGGTMTRLQLKLDADLGFHDNVARDSPSIEVVLKLFPVGLRDSRCSRVARLRAARLQVKAQNADPTTICERPQ